MKKRIIATFAILALFALAIAAFAYTRTTTVETSKACCCKSGDSCPMKSKGHDEKGGEHKMSCCKKHDGEHSAAAGDHACCGCCGDSCPMKKGEATVSATGADKSCCEGCECCKHKDG